MSQLVPPTLALPTRLAGDGHALANEFISGLLARPFKPTATQLASIWGGALAPSETATSRVRIAAGRYAAMLTEHLIEDVAADGVAAAYARIWLCARLAFIESVMSSPSVTAANPALSSWEGEGGHL